MRAFRNMRSVTVLNVPQLRELSVSVAFVDVKDVKLENASLLGKCEELKRVVEKKSDDVVVRVKDVGVLPVEKRMAKKNDCCCDDCITVIVVLLMLGGVGCMIGGIAVEFIVALFLVGLIMVALSMALIFCMMCEEANCC